MEIKCNPETGLPVIIERMKKYDQQEITRLLLAWGAGNQQAFDELLPLVYEELRRVAARHMRRRLAPRQDGRQLLQTTVLVNEAYLRLIDSHRVRWQNRAHFFAVAASLMRRVLVDYARQRQSQKRGGEMIHVAIDEAAVTTPSRAADLVALDEALSSLATLNDRQARVVELRYFGGLSEDEVATALKISRRTVQREWRLARLWLYQSLKRGAVDVA